LKIPRKSGIRTGEEKWKCDGKDVKTLTDGRVENLGGKAMGGKVRNSILFKVGGLSKNIKKMTRGERPHAKKENERGKKRWRAR